MNDRVALDVEHRQGTELQKNKALETFDTMKGAVIGVAANTFKDLLGQLIPGFHEQFEKTARQKSTSGVSVNPDPSRLSASTR
jgi:alpha-acetolactate decarboxylase